MHTKKRKDSFVSYWQTYLQAMIEAQRAIMEREAAAIEEAARVIAASLRRGGVLHLFGSGHSHLPVEEGFYRAGGLAAVSPLLDPGLMFHEGVERCIALEKWDGYATRFILPHYDLRPGEVMMVFSASGRNHAPIEVALKARERGLYTIGVTSRRYAAAFPSRHPSGQHLADVVDLVLDHAAPPGDTLVPIEERPELGGTGAASTALAIVLLHAVFAAVIEDFVRAGEEPPLIRCPNAGSEAENLLANARTLASYRARLRHL
jgi:uncharacterized phosphosugar-binding protein